MVSRLGLVLALLLLASSASAWSSAGRQESFVIWQIPDLQRWEDPTECNTTPTADPEAVLNAYFDTPTEFRYGHPDFYPGVPLAALISVGDMLDAGYTPDRWHSNQRTDCNTVDPITDCTDGRWAGLCAERAQDPIDRIYAAFERSATAGVCATPGQGNHDIAHGRDFGINVAEPGSINCNAGELATAKWRDEDCNTLTVSGGGWTDDERNGAYKWYTDDYGDTMPGWVPGATPPTMRACGYLADDGDEDDVNTTLAMGDGLGINKVVSFVAGGRRHRLFTIQMDPSPAAQTWIQARLAEVPSDEGIIAMSHWLSTCDTDGPGAPVASFGTWPGLRGPNNTRDDVGNPSIESGSVVDDLGPDEWIDDFTAKKNYWFSLAGHLRRDGGVGCMHEVAQGGTDCGPNGVAACRSINTVNNYQQQGAFPEVNLRPAIYWLVYPKKNKIIQRTAIPSYRESPTTGWFFETSSQYITPRWTTALDWWNP
jgi:hypothetical protein